MSDILLVPIHLDALFLEKDTAVTAAKADFTLMPFFNGKFDVNPDTANISESVVSKAFANHNLTLKTGMHLHWSLPDALTKGVHKEGKLDFPRVPNRWYVQRTKNGQQKRWLIESDYLHPEDDENTYGGIAYPIDLNDPKTPPEWVQPFRYMGRQIAFDNWQEDSKAEPQVKLTAVGYGESTFAAFYPNCHSVFGCYDKNLTKSDLDDSLTYHVIGWYSNDGHDPLNALITEATKQNKSIEEIQAAIKQVFQWQTSIASNTPNTLCCYAKLTFNPGTDLNHPDKNTPVKVAVAYTGTEALSTYLATDLAKQPGAANKAKIEEQLEAIQLSHKLANKLDIGPKFNEARHEKGFTAVSGGKLWVITPKNADQSADKKTEAKQNSQIDISLPVGLAHQLNQLNSTQQAWNDSAAEITSLRQQLFADWYKYILAAYPPSDSHDDYPDVDAVAYYIKHYSIKAVTKAVAAQLALETTLTHQKNTTTEAINAFNDSTLLSKNLLQRLDKEATLANPWKAVNTQWLDNTPFSAQCLGFSAEKSAYLHIAKQNNIKALSLWVNISSTQNAPAYLLSTIDSNSTTASISTLGIDPLWNKLFINGQQQNPALPHNWLSLPKDKWFHLYIEAKTSFNSDIYLMTQNETAGYLTGKLAGVRLFNEALSLDDITTDMNMLGHHSYHLQPQAAPRYWQPKEPVVLLAGEAITPSNRHAADGRLHKDSLLACDITHIKGSAATNVGSLINIIDTLAPAAGVEKIGFGQWENHPWHPFMLEWEVEAFPIVEHSNLAYKNNGYHPDFITGNFTLEEQKPEVTAKSTARVTQNAWIYSGSSILTPNAKHSLMASLENLLNNLKKSDCAQIIGKISADESASYDTKLKSWLTLKPPLAATAKTAKVIADFRKWYESKPVYDNKKHKLFSKLNKTHKANNLIYTAIQAYQMLYDKPFISQALSGFNAAFLMRKQTLQLPIADPIGFADYASLSDSVRATVGNENKTAPLPLNCFNPIRAGAMNLLRLHIIDTFGQIKNDIDPKQLVLPERQTARDYFIEGANRDRMLLNPAFVQPTKLSFRWLAADNGEQEMNTHPASSPICGWLLANHLDNSLMIYNQAGETLGLINQTAHWQAAPGTDVIVATADINNPYLRQVVEKLAIATADETQVQTDKQAFFNDFISVTDKALAYIDSETFAQHSDLALLMGRPIAVVRAALNLAVQGKAAVDLGWHTAIYDDSENFLNKGTAKFEQVKVPIRIGERQQLNDGLLGYWQEDANRQLSEYFYSIVESTEVSHEKIKTPNHSDFNLSQSITDPAQSLTLLIDPRAKIHATCGILPTKAIDIPVNQYRKALARLNISFLSAPILTTPNKLQLPLNSEPGYSWSWLQKRGAHWQQTATDAVVTQTDFSKTAANVWQELIRVGWIIPIDADHAKVVAKDQRLASNLGDTFAGHSQVIEDILDRGQINPIETHTSFSGHAEAQEGWLKLQPVKH